MNKDILRSLKSICKDFTLKHYLLAVSGGIDSMTLLHLFMRAELKFSVAHCNFRLRGKESERDENFVKDFCRQNNIPLYHKQFDTKQFAIDNKMSIQEAAREIRYAYFNDIAESGNFNFIVTAHNRDDVLESFFINLYRSSGVKGLASIPKRNGRIIRPLLDFSRDEILKFAERQNILYVEDSSNDEDKYLRNKIRHKLLPLAEEIMPAFVRRAQKSIEFLRKTADNIENEARNRLNDLLIMNSDNTITIQAKALLKEPFIEQIVLQLLRKEGFTVSILQDVIDALGSTESKYFYTKTRRMIARSDSVIIGNNTMADDAEYILDLDLNIDEIPIISDIKIGTIKSKKDIHTNKNMLQLNKIKVDFPLIIRRWRSGDTLKPLGMQGFKKVSDYLTDRKLSVIEKENVFVLVSSNNIVAIMGYEISEDYAIRQFPTEALILNLSK